mgnify:FL=1
MKLSESIVNDLLREVDSLTYRIRVINQCLGTASNIRLKARLINENNTIYKRISEINEVSELLNENSSDKISFSALLKEKSMRSLNELKTGRNLFFL